MRLRNSPLWAILFMSASASADPIDAVIRDQMAASHLPGVAVAVVDDGRITKVAGYGDANLEWPAKVDGNTRFQLASATKIFTGILLMRAVEQGRLRLDASIDRFFPGAPPAWSRITVRQLANHSSGLSESLGQPRPKTLPDAVAAAMKQPLAYEPGTDVRYGFTDFTILRAVIEKACGASLPDLLDREIARPLRLQGTGFALAREEGPVRTGEIIPRRASIYAWTGERQRTSDFFFEPLGYGAGGLFSTAADLARLFAALDRGELVGEAGMRELVTPATLPGGRTSGFGVGWSVRSYRGVQVVGHSGGPALADILRIPSQRRTIVVLTNQQNFYPLLAERVADLTLPKARAPAVADDRRSLSQAIVGFFRALRDGTGTSRFLAPGSTAAEPLQNAFGRALIEGVGPIDKATFIGPERSGSRRYRIDFERKSMDWIVVADPAGLIVDLHPA